MTLVAILALALQGDSAVRDALAFLVRHQAPDGSWGARPEGCACPAPATVAPEVADVEALGDDDVGARAEAQRRLEAAGVAALPLLQEAAQSGEAEVRARALESIGRILSRRERGDIELTALAIHAFLAAGYTHHSRGEGIAFAPAIRGGLRWLVEHQEPEGSWGTGDAMANAVAAQAVVLMEGKTRSINLRDASARALTFLKWSSVRDGMALLWTRSTLMTVGGPEPEGPLLWRDPVEAACGAAMFRVSAGKPADPAIIARIEGAVWGRRTPRETYWITGALQNVDSGGRLFPGWLNRAKAELGSTRLGSGCGAGSWETAGLRRRLEAAAYGVMVLSQVEWRGGRVRRVR